MENVELHTCLLNIFNNVLKDDCFDRFWRAKCFTLLRNMGDDQDQIVGGQLSFLMFLIFFPFSMLICQTLRTTSDSHPSIDPTGFKLGTGIEEKELSAFPSHCATRALSGDGF